MTVDDMIKELQRLSALGYGEYRLVCEYNYNVFDAPLKAEEDEHRGKTVQIF